MGNSFFSIWIPRYLHHLQMRNYSPRTIKTYRGVLKHFAAYVWLVRHPHPGKLVIYEKDFVTAREDTGVTIDEVILNDYFLFLNASYTYRPKTLHRIISTLSSFYHFLIFQGVIDLNPVERIDRPRLKEQDIIYLKHTQVLQLLDSIPDRRDRLIVRTIYATGVRVSELCAIDIRDIDFEDHIIKVKGKGGKIRTVFIDDDTLAEIREYIDGKTFGPLFLGQQNKPLSARTIQRIFQQYAPKGITPHKIRHSYASELYRRSKNLRVVQENLGHSSIKTTEIYLHTDMDERKRVYDEYFPLSDKNHQKKKPSSQNE